ncbi:acyltransferase family protein [Microbacterium sp. NPDC058269]|uniref:acyltransferase family protein n=1 Tax=Microbacterium sp. NPDC058269 TaxID=3346414 RepID=UPI0036DB8B1F
MDPGAADRSNDRTAPGQNSSRFIALDGLRGVAAVMVVVYHFLLATKLSDEYLRVLSGETSSSPVVGLIANTPLRYLVMGPEAVIVFFVLSGFVLVLPMLRGRGLDLWNYFPRRLLRLWLPSAAAVVLAIIVIVATRQDPAQVASSWSQAFSFPTLTAGDVVDSFFLITGSPKLNNPLWTLRWELLFSLLLPIAVLLVRGVKRRQWLWILVCGAASGIGAVVGVQALAYGPVFLAGGLLASTVVARDGDASRRTSWAWFVGGILLIAVPDIVRLALPGDVQGFLRPFSQGFVVTGAVLLVYALIGDSGLSRFFSLGVFRFLGRISFSLYLIHVPLLLGAIHLVPAHPMRAMVVALPVIFVVAWVFTRVVEEPSAAFARRVGERASLSARRLAMPEPSRRVG